MSKISQIPKWLFRAWPILGLLPIGLLHYYLFHAFPNSRPLIHKILAATLQTLGGIIVIYFINDNIGTFKNKNIIQIVIEWAKAFPFFSRSVIVGVSGVAGMAFVGSAEATVTRSCTTLEERVEELERQLGFCRELIFRKEKEILGKLDSTKSEIEHQLLTQSQRIDTFTKILEISIVGTFKFQFFGVLLAIYGAIVSIFA